jgi:predicted DNA-binding WGR domain protein
MPDNLRSPIKHHLVPHRIKSEHRIQYFHSLMIERDLFGASRLVRQRGRIGTKGQEEVEGFATKAEAGHALEAPASVRRQRMSKNMRQINSMTFTPLPQNASHSDECFRLLAGPKGMSHGRQS